MGISDVASGQAHRLTQHVVGQCGQGGPGALEGVNAQQVPGRDPEQLEALPAGDPGRVAADYGGPDVQGGQHVDG